uniref:Cyclin N-terminal domain-containing protein n=1 Tax=Clastoptera arizonana TaxID=38151 RepID=A0A1B6DLX3_9HEMI
MDQGPPDALQPLLQQLKEACVLEHKYKPNLQLPTVSDGGSEVTVGIRDGSAHVLRCLKVWYDMPSEVLFVAINLMDRFLTKVKARPKHMACLSVASFQLAAQFVCGVRTEGPPAPEPSDVASISQCKCTMGDLARMQGIIKKKLGTQFGLLPITAADFLRIFHALFLAVDEGQVYARCVNPNELWQRLEIVACDAACANFRASEIALVMICTLMDTGVAHLQPAPPGHAVLSVVSFAGQLQQFCRIPESSFSACHQAVLAIIAQYNAQSQLPHRQRLVWRLSQRTLRYLRPTDKLVKTLPTISEHGQPIPRSRSGSSSSEDSWESDDWVNGTV